MSDNPIIVCRCEEVSYDAIQDAIKAGASNAQELKMATRAGMGMCQGRICRMAMDCLFSKKQKGILENPNDLTIHQPVRPVPLSKIIDWGMVK